MEHQCASKGREEGASRERAVRHWLRSIFRNYKELQKKPLKRFQMQRLLVYVVIILICTLNVMQSVNGCNTSLRPGKNRDKPCVGL
ncbi:hypothetical protein V5799_031102, partial [Amblyomma americanum]